jgi:hypothetical protein
LLDIHYLGDIGFFRTCAPWPLSFAGLGEAEALIETYRAIQQMEDL